MSMKVMGFGLSRNLALSLVSFYSLTSLAIGPAPVSPQAFKLQAINSPVKENQAKFLLSSSASLSLTQASYWIEASQSAKPPHAKGGAVPIHLRSPSKTSVTLKPVTDGYEADVVASELAPGDYVFYLEVNPKTRLETAWTAILNFLHLPSTRLAIIVGAEFSVDTSLEVPDPGAEGKTTLAGIDSDGDGIRDDVQRWINENYNSSPNIHAALKQVARDLQSDQLSVNDKAKSIEATNQLFHSMECLYAVTGGVLKAKPIFQKLNEMMVNTRQRILADIKGNGNYNGQTYQLPKRADRSKFCRFPIAQ